MVKQSSADNGTLCPQLISGNFLFSKHCTWKCDILFANLQVVSVCCLICQAGPSVCQALHELLVRLQMRCDVVTTTSKYGNSLKELLLKLVYQLVQPSGALANRQGPLDAQCKLLELLLNLNFANIDLSTAMSILESVGKLCLYCGEQEVCSVWPNHFLIFTKHGIYA